MKLSSVLFISLSFFTQASSLIWTAGSGGEFKDAENWRPRIDPDEADHLVINNGSKVDFQIAPEKQYQAGVDFIISSEGSLLIDGNGSEWTTDETNWSYVGGRLVVKNSGVFKRAAKSGNLIFGFDPLSKGSETTEVLVDGGVISSSNEVWFGHENGAKSRTKLTLKRGGKFSAIGGEGAAVFVWKNALLEINFLGEGVIEVGAAGLKYGGNSAEALNAGRFENLWKSGLLTYRGSNKGNFDDHFTVSGTNGESTYTLTAKQQGSNKKSELGSALISIGNMKILLMSDKEI